MSTITHPTLELSPEVVEAIASSVRDTLLVVAKIPKIIEVRKLEPDVQTAEAFLFGEGFEERGFEAHKKYPVYRIPSVNGGLWFVEHKEGARSLSLTGNPGFWVEDPTNPNRDARTGLRLRRWGGVIV